MKPIIALAQIKYSRSSKENKEKIKQFIRKAKKLKADIVCFPESCLHETKSFNLKDPLIKEIQEECKKNSIWCIITEDIKIRSKLLLYKRTYGAALLIDRKGEIKGIYKKINPYGDNVKLGKKPGVFKTDFAKIGIAICWDIAFPKLFSKMKKQGAEIIFCPSQWWYDEEAHKNNHKKRDIQILESLVTARAYENVCFVAVCNPVMKSKRQVSYTSIASPTKLLKRIINKEGIITAEINLNEIKKMQKLYDS